MLNQQINKEFLLQQLEKLPPEGLAEVAKFIEFLQFRQQKPVQKVAQGKHTAFGIWANRPEAADPVAFAQTIRQRIEKRQDV